MAKSETNGHAKSMRDHIAALRLTNPDEMAAFQSIRREAITGELRTHRVKVVSDEGLVIPLCIHPLIATLNPDFHRYTFSPRHVTCDRCRRRQTDHPGSE